jgi:hypothetical protein
MAKDWERKLKRELKNEVLKEFEGWSNGEFVSLIIDLREEITRLETQLTSKQSVAGGKSNKEPLTESKFKQDWSYPTKIHFLLELHQKPLTSEDLHGFLSKIDTHYKDYDSPRNNLSVALGRASKSGRIKKIKEPGIKLKYFALPEWIDSQGKLLETFQSQINYF